MARRALAALALAALVAAARAPDPCCLRVTPYHIQALAQRMAQRFQALEYRAQDLRGVFASFQAVHGNVSHRLRYLEAEHAHLSEVVSRLDSRLHSLEEEKHIEQYRRYNNRGYRGAGGEIWETHPDEPMRIRLRTRRRRDEDAVLPHLDVRLEQSSESSHDSAVVSSAAAFTSSFPVDVRPSDVSAVGNDEVPGNSDGQLGAVHIAGHTSSERVLGDGSSTLLPLLMKSATIRTPVLSPPASDGPTVPTPLWQLEETATALVAAMNEDEENGNANGSDVVEAGVSYWAPANESDSLEDLFNTAETAQKPEIPARDGQSMTNCSTDAPEVAQTNTEAVTDETSTEAAILDSVAKNLKNSHVASSLHVSVVPVSSTSDAVSNSSITNPQSEDSKLSESSVKTTGCKSGVRVPAHDEAPSSLGNLTHLLMDLGNSSDALLGVFSSSANGPVQAGSAPVPTDGGSGGAGATTSCGAAGCDAELSDAELQTALRELDALLKRPPASASPPDPEKLLLKRALTLALAALERTSDACLKLVNFTADAFEGLAAAEA